MPKAEKLPPFVHNAQTRQVVLDLLTDGIGDDEEPAEILISGQCMEPLIIDGDRVSVAPCQGSPGLGDIVLARTPDQELVCHRILGRSGDDYLLAGDRTLRLDTHPPETVIGRVIAVHRGAKTLTLPRAGRIARFQAYLHLKTHAYRGRSLALLFHWPRRLLIEAQAWRWHSARIRPE